MNDFIVNCVVMLKLNEVDGVLTFRYCRTSIHIHERLKLPSSKCFFVFRWITTELEYNSISKQCDKPEEKLLETSVSWSKIGQKQT